MIRGELQLNSALFVVNRVVDAGFTCDIAINFNLQFYDTESKLWVTSRPAIAQAYLQGMAIVDVVSTVPFDVARAPATPRKPPHTPATRATRPTDLALYPPPQVTLLDPALQPLRVLRVLRLIKLLRILRSQRVIRRLEDQAGVPALQP